MVNKIKYKSNGEVKRYKARLKAKGYNRKDDLDFHDTFSSVAKMVYVRTITSLVTSKNWSIS